MSNLSEELDRSFGIRHRELEGDRVKISIRHWRAQGGEMEEEIFFSTDAPVPYEVERQTSRGIVRITVEVVEAPDE